MRAAGMKAFMLLLCFATLGVVAPARAQVVVVPGDPDIKLIRTIVVPLTVVGTLGVEFHAGPDTGCPAPCDVAGTVRWVPAGRGSLIVYEHRVGKERELTAPVVLLPDDDRPSTTTTVTRARPAGGWSSCVDARGELFGTLNFSAGRSDAIVAQLLGAPTGPGPGPDLLGTRCAGPNGDDLASLLPRPQLTRDVLVRGGVSLDFSAERAFAAHGFGGVLRSSVKMLLGRATIDLDPEAATELPRHVRTRRLRQLTATYSIERPVGSVVTSFAGTREPALCGGLDSCGTTGTVDISPVPVAGEATFTAIGTRRSTRRQLAAALGLAPGPVPRGVEVIAVAYWDEDSGTAVTSTRNADGQLCNERATLGGGALRFEFQGRRVRAVYGEPGSFPRDPFSTRCAGPALSDAAGEGALATGSLRRADFRRKRVTVSLKRGVKFAAEGYEGSSRSSLSTVLRRTGVHRGTFLDLVPVS